jgi:branched-chain amino acid transport system substrate-binding protein
VTLRVAFVAALALLSSCADEPTTPPGQACRYLGTLEREGAPIPPEPDDTCTVIGTINPLSGPLGPVGFALENAARLAVRDVNGAGGVASRKLCLVACDDRTDPSTVPGIVEELLGKYRAVAINGSAASASTLAAAKAAASRSIPIVSCCSTSALLTDDPNVFRTVPSDALQGVVLGGVARSLPEPASRVAIVHVDDAYGSSLKSVFESALVALGGTVVAAVPYKPGSAQYLDVVASALEPEPDHVALFAFPTDGAQILRDWRDSGLGPRVRWLATDGLKDEGFVQGAAGLARGVIGTAPLLVGAHYGRFEARYRTTFGGESPGIFTSNQYDAMILIALGLARAGRVASSAQVREAIREVSRPGGASVSADDITQAIREATDRDVDYSGASGEVDLDDRGDITTDYGVWEAGSSGVRDLGECWRCRSESGTVACSRTNCVEQ